MNNTWKYQIGDQVRSILQELNPHSSKMIIIGRLTEEHAQFTRYSYLCATYSLGEAKQMVAEEIELTPI
jgi:hypothetical protein